MPEQDSRLDWQKVRFLARFQADQEEDRARSAEEYARIFPGLTEEIIRDALLAEASANAGHRAEHRWLLPLEVGADFGRYHLLELLGKGGQGIVYLAEDRVLSRKVALKVLPPSICPLSKEHAQRLFREATLASRLDHPGICTIYDRGEENGAYFLAMRYVEGKPVSVLLTAERERQGAAAPFHCVGFEGSQEVAEPERIRILAAFVEKVARALHVAHQSGIIHRDIKPANLMAAVDGDPVILDFGLARDADPDESSLTRTGDLFGTPAYMAPEQLRGGQIDRRVDIWGLGVVLYECLTLQRPFSADASEGIYHAIALEDQIDPGKLNPDIPAELKLVIGKALEKNRRRRYRTALDFAKDLRRFQDLQPVRARAAGHVRIVRKWIQRNPVLTTVLFGIFLVLASAFGTTFMFYSKERREREAVEKRLGRSTSLATKILSNALNATHGLPNTVRAKQSILRYAVRHLELIAQDTAKLMARDPAALEDLSAAFLALGDELGFVDGSNVGDGLGALDCYRRVLSLVELPEVVPRQSFRLKKLLVLGYQRMGRTLDGLNRAKEAIENFSEAQALALDLEANYPRNLEVGRLRSAIQVELASVMAKLQGSHASLEYWRTAKSTTESYLDVYPEDSVLKMQLVGCYRELGRYHEGHAALATARTQFLEARSILETLVVEFPSRLEYHEALASVQAHMGSLLLESGECTTALTLFDKALVLQRYVYGKDETNERAARQFLDLSRARAMGMLRAGRFAAALRVFKEVERLAQLMQRRFQGAEFFSRSLMGIHLGYGELLTLEQEFEAAAWQLSEASGIAARFFGDAKERLDNIAFLAKAELALARLERKKKSYRKSLEHLRRAGELFAEHQSRQPESVLAIDAMFCTQELGLLFSEMPGVEEPMQHFKRAEEACARLMTRVGMQTSLLRLQVENYLGMSRLLRRRGRGPESLSRLGDALRLVESWLAQHPEEQGAQTQLAHIHLALLRGNVASHAETKAIEHGLRAVSLLERLATRSSLEKASRYLLANCRLELGLLLARAGHGPRARSMLKQALSPLELREGEKDASGWKKEFDASSKRIRVAIGKEGRE